MVESFKLNNEDKTRKKHIPTQTRYNTIFEKYLDDDNADPNLAKKELCNKDEFQWWSENFRIARIKNGLWTVRDVMSKRQFRWWNKNNTAKDIEPSLYEVL